MTRYPDASASASAVPVSRRGFFGLAAGAAAASSGLGPARVAMADEAPRPARAAARSRPNILFLFSDQERYRSSWPAGLSLPGQEMLRRKGVTFHAHYCPATMCTSSRSVLMTGLTTPNNGMFENCDVPWIKGFPPGVQTIGHMLRKAGYYTAYKGKWHLNKEFDSKDPDLLFTGEMERYGFADYNGPGDIIGHTLGGYQFDHLISGSAVTWLRRNGRPLSDDGKPWCLFVSLVNPHDVMYFNTDLPGERVQDPGGLMMQAARAPDHPLYRKSWDQPLPTSLREPLDAPGRPKAHGEFMKAWRHILGEVPMEEERWHRFNDYYVNCTRGVDAQLARVLGELDDLGLADRTIVIYTTDHGEAAGAHGMRGKGPFAYQEAIHLPFYLIHPDVGGGQDCRALSSHIDMVPTLLSMAGVPSGGVGELAGRDLPGKDLSPLLAGPASAGVHAVRDAVLFTYSGLALNDAGIMERNAAARAAGKNAFIELARQRYLPDLKKRGSLRTVFDGRYKFSRYFAPTEHNEPTTLDQLYDHNDVELFDLERDPSETDNLARDRVANKDLILAMNAKLNTIIRTEIGVDDGRELPNIPLVDWAIDRVDM
ncbi:sulfatase-like hydrolase/transferase [Skermanella rosea]|uniref:sulfatase-like hydrolase/transferase n=1 Tax=Skermanella rosea TaxID=1817965 RepID=UPI001932C250|nr:sulfatase-like hydrolase/transferase [Skermanella rosea]